MVTEAATKLVAALPAKLARWMLVASLMGFIMVAAAINQTNERVRQLELKQVRVEEQRQAEVRAVQELTDEVRGYRSAVMAEIATLRSK